MFSEPHFKNTLQEAIPLAIPTSMDPVKIDFSNLPRLTFSSSTAASPMRTGSPESERGKGRAGSDERLRAAYASIGDTDDLFDIATLRSRVEDLELQQRQSVSENVERLRRLLKKGPDWRPTEQYVATAMEVVQEHRELYDTVQQPLLSMAQKVNVEQAQKIRDQNGELEHLRQESHDIDQLREDNGELTETLRTLRERMEHYQPSSTDAENASYDELLSFKKKHTGVECVQITPEELGEISARLEERDQLLKLVQRMDGELNRLLDLCRTNNLDPRPPLGGGVKLYQGE